MENRNEDEAEGEQARAGLRAVLLPRRAEVEAGPTEDEGRTRGGTPGWPDAGAAIHPRLGHRGRTAAEVKALI